jgi:hypothetical protein
MIKCYFVDIKDISSDVPRSNFAESDLAKLATLILATDGLIRPLIVKESGAEKYQVVEGHLEYYAALKAKEQNSSKAEMVNAFVINDKIQASAIEQLKLLKDDRAPATTPIASEIDRLLPTIITAISQQIQPLVDQLAEQQKMLELLTLDRAAPVDIQPIHLPSIQPSAPENIAPTPTPVVVEPKPSKTAKNKPEKIKPEKINPDPAPKTPRASTKTKTAPPPIANESSKEANPLNLINTLSQSGLILAMERSGVSKAAIKLVPDIMTSRAIQPNQKFETWDAIVSLKIKGLGAGTIKGIIEKLK